MIRAGLRHVWALPELRATLLLTVGVGTLGFNHHVVVPVLAMRTFDGDATTYKLLYAAMSAGAVAGALMVARRGAVDLTFLGRAAVGFGCTLALVALAPSLPFALVAAPLAGGAALVFIAGSTALLRLRAAPGMRGRVMSLSTLVLVGTAPVGAPALGWIAQHAGPRSALLFAGAVAVASGLTALAPALRVDALVADSHPGTP